MAMGLDNLQEAELDVVINNHTDVSEAP